MIVLRPRSTDELIHHMPSVAELSTSEWAAGFARSIMGQSRRRGWQPTPKQRQLMARLVDELFDADADLADAGDLIVIDEGDAA